MAENMTEAARLLVVSRESAILRPLWTVAEDNAWQIETAVNPWDAIERVQSGAAPHLLVLDLPRGDGDSLHLLRWLRRLRPDLPVIVTCFPEDAGREKEAMRLGAQEVLIRPLDQARLESAVRRHLLSSESDEPEVASEDIEQLGPDSFFVSASPITQKLRAQAELLAEADVPVLILGEAGSGKDTVARLIHKLSVRSGFSFLKVNCADMPGELLEAELCGSERTPVPGNGRGALGKLERAEKGTIFLDEIAEMPLTVQARLMQVLQDKALFKPGHEKAVPIDVRIIAATDANPERLLADRKLREDLYYRLSAFTIQVPPLRQRKSEIAVLLQHSMHQLSRHYGLPSREFSGSMLDACQNYSWPGNLNELENFVKRYLVAGDSELALGDLEWNLAETGGADGRSGAAKQAAPKNGSSFADNRSSSKSLKSLINSVKCEAERNAIATALQKTGWNRKAAARLLQVSYRTLLYKIDQYQMNAPESFLSSLPGGKYPFNGNPVKANGKTG